MSLPSWSEIFKEIHESYLCNEISNHTNYLDKMSFQKQGFDQFIKMEIFELKISLKYPHMVSGIQVFEFERSGENVGKIMSSDLIVLVLLGT